MAYHSDMRKVAPDAQLLAVTHQWADYYKRRTQAVLDGTWKSGNVWGGVREGMIRVGWFGSKVPKKVQDEVLARQKDIAAGHRHGKRIGAGDQRQRDQNFDRIVVDQTHSLIGDVTRRDTKQQASASFHQQQLADGPGPGLFRAAADRKSQQYGEQHDADAIVEQRFALHLDFERRRHPDVLQRAQHRHRVGRADERAEHQ